MAMHEDKCPHSLTSLMINQLHNNMVLLYLTLSPLSSLDRTKPQKSKRGQSHHEVREDSRVRAHRNDTTHNHFGSLPTVHFHTDSKGRPAEIHVVQGTPRQENTPDRKVSKSPSQLSVFGVCVPRQVTQFPKTVLNSSTVLLNIARVSFSSGQLLALFF